MNEDIRIRENNKEIEKEGKKKGKIESTKGRKS